MDVSREDVEHIVEEYEAILLHLLRVKKSKNAKWEIPHCCIIAKKKDWWED